MKIEVEISQQYQKGGVYVPGLIGLCIQQEVGERISPTSYFPPDICCKVDLTAEEARDLASELNRHARLVEDAREG